MAWLFGEAVADLLLVLDLVCGALLGYCPLADNELELPLLLLPLLESQGGLVPGDFQRHVDCLIRLLID